MKEGCQAGSELAFHGLQSLQLCDLPKVSLPIQREYANIQLALARVMLLILESHIEEEKVKHDVEKAKGHVQKVRVCDLYTCASRYEHRLELRLRPFGPV